LQRSALVHDHQHRFGIDRIARLTPAFRLRVAFFHSMPLTAFSEVFLLYFSFSDRTTGSGVNREPTTEN